ncbi:hypothetical protein D3C71_1341330 [compost metagenome]
MAGTQCGLAGAHDGFGGGEIRFTDFQMDHVMTGLLQRIGAGQQGHDVEGGDFVAAAAVAGRRGGGRVHRRIIGRHDHRGIATNGACRPPR